jgi:hypothetical protein
MEYKSDGREGVRMGEGGRSIPQAPEGEWDISYGGRSI